MYSIKLVDHTVSYIGPFKNKKEVYKERTNVIRRYFGNSYREKGYVRESLECTVIFRHAVYATVIVDIIEHTAVNDLY